MKECKITVDVYASWSDRSPTYRVYVDGELLTERDFIWSGTSTFVRENIIVNLAPGQHNVTVEQTNAQGKINTRNIQVNGTASATDFVIIE